MQRCRTNYSPPSCCRYCQPPPPPPPSLAATRVPTVTPPLITNRRLGLFLRILLCMQLTGKEKKGHKGREGGRRRMARRRRRRRRTRQSTNDDRFRPCRYCVLHHTTRAPPFFLTFLDRFPADSILSLLLSSYCKRLY